MYFPIQTFPRTCARIAASLGVCLLAILAITACTDQAVAGVGKAAGPAQNADAGPLADVAPSAEVLSVQAEKHADKGGYVEMEGVWNEEAASLEVRVYVGGFAALYGLAGHLRYDPEGLELKQLDMKPVPMGPNSDSPTWTARSVGKDVPAGRILMGGARLARKPHIYLPLEGAKVNRELWATAHFRVKQVGDWKLEFDPAQTVTRGSDGKDQPAWWGKATVLVKQLPASDRGAP